MKKSPSSIAILATCIMLTIAFSVQSQSEHSDQGSTINNENTVTDDKINTQTPTGENTFETLHERFSYAYGIDTIRRFRQEGIELNIPALIEGLQNAFDGIDERMSLGEVTMTMEVYQKVHLKKKEAEKAILAEKNKKEGDDFLEKNAKKEGIIVTTSGLQYKVITKGTGAIPTREHEVTVHYRGSFINGTEFDSSYKREKPTTFKVKQVIEGWSEALTIMSEGSKWELYIPAEIAYGERGSGTAVGPNATLTFEVDLIKVFE